MTGRAMPWNNKPSGQQKEDAQAARDLAEKQKILTAQQERELTQNKKKLQARQIAMLRSRFGVAGGGGGGGGAAAGGGLQSMSDTSSSLFARITGN